MASRLVPIIRKEFIQMRRDRLTLGMMLFIPAMQLLLFGYAINTDVMHLPTVVYDASRQQESREIIDAFRNSKYYDMDYYVDSYQEMAYLIDSGQAKVGLVFPPDFSTKVKRGESASLQVIVDASDPMVAASAISTAQAIGQVKSLEIISQTARARQTFVSQGLPVDVRLRAWYNPDLRSAVYIVPGLLGIILLMTNMTITAMAIVRERERGTLEQLIVTPLKRYELIIGKVAPYILVGYVQMTLALGIAYLVFKVPIAGSLILLYSVTLLFIIATQGLGIFISTLARTQQQAMQMSFFVFLPHILLSGFMFPIHAMPEAIQYLTRILPLTYFLEVLRGIILKGNGLNYLSGQLIPLALIGAILITYSVSRFHKKLE